jgi:hypothetical protein
MLHQQATTRRTAGPAAGQRAVVGELMIGGARDGPDPSFAPRARP